jgi:hypothetical protein
METISFDETSHELTSQLESILARLSVAADSNLSTYTLEDKAKKLAAKIKSIAFLINLPIYTNIENGKMWNPSDDLPSALFFRYADLCKKLSDAVEVYHQDNAYYAKISDKVFINLYDLPEVEVPAFKVKIEGNTLMAVRADLFEKLPSSTKKLLDNKSED